MHKFLVIGGNGVLGHFVTRGLVKEGHRPVVLSRGGDATLIVDVLKHCDNVRGDITDRKFIDDIVRTHSISHIVHLAAALPSIAEVDPAAAIRLNVEGTAHVLEAARNNGVKRVVMASTKAVYGRVKGSFAPPTYAPVPETCAAPETVYGISKWTSELLGRWYANKYGIEFVALRFGATIGPGKIARHGGSFSRYSVIIESAMAGKPVVIDSGADEICDGLFNAEAARGVICALLADKPKFDVYNIATGTGFTLREYAAAVKRLFPEASISVGTDSRPPSTSNFILDASRAREEWDFVADSSVDHIVAAYVSTMQLLGLAPDVA